MTKTTCDLCGGTPNPSNFGALCDPCETARQARTDRLRATLRRVGQADSDFGRAIRA